MSAHSTGSTRPHRKRPSSTALDAAFEKHATLEPVRAVHALYVEAAISLLRVAHRMEAINEMAWVAPVESVVVLIEEQAARHIEAIAKRHAGNGGGVDHG